MPIENNKEEQVATEFLENVLKQSNAKGLDQFYKQNWDKMLDVERPFTAYMREILKKNKVSQRDMFMTAGITDSYGYKVISMEKPTKNRDLIIRLCLAAHMELVEVNRALKLYGMTPLYAKISRDAALIVAFNTHMYNMADVDDMLMKYGFEPLYDYDEDD